MIKISSNVGSYNFADSLAVGDHSKTTVLLLILTEVFAPSRPKRL